MKPWQRRRVSFQQISFVREFEKVRDLIECNAYFETRCPIVWISWYGAGYELAAEVVLYLRIVNRDAADERLRRIEQIDENYLAFKHSSLSAALT